MSAIDPLRVDRRQGRLFWVCPADRDVKHLFWLCDQLGDKVKDLVVVSTGPTAYRRGDGVAVVLLVLLGP